MESLPSVLAIKARGRQCRRAVLLGCCLCASSVLTAAEERVDSVCPTIPFITRLSGWVIDEHGAPITNATVSAWAPNYSWQVVTNANTDQTGRVELPLFGGFWNFSATAPAPASPETLFPQIKLRIIDGVDQSNFSFIARVPTNEVVVSFQDSSGSNLVADGFVSASITLGITNYTTQSRTDPSGRASLRLWEGIWRLTAGLAPQDSNGVIGIPARTITVTGTTQTVSWMVQSPTSHLRGRVMDDLGAPISNAWVIADHFVAGGDGRVGSWSGDSGSETEEAETTTGMDGVFEFTLFAGSWNLTAFLPHAGYAYSHTSLRNLTVLEGQDRTNVQLIVPRLTAQISGSVKDTSGHPMERFLVGGSTKIGDQAFQTSGLTDDQGQFWMPAFEADWSVFAEFQVVDRSNCPISSYWQIVPARTVTVNGTNVSVEFVVEPLKITARLEGRIVDRAGAPVSMLYVSATNSEGTSRSSALSGSAGVFAFEAFAGAWSITAGNFQDANGVFLGPKVSIAVEDGVDQTNLLLVAQRSTARITGAITDNDARGLAGLFLFASAEVEGTNYSSGGVTDASGHFEIDVLDGHWQVGVYDWRLNGLGFASVPAQSVTVLGANETIQFVAQRIHGDGRVPTLAWPIRLSDGTLQLKVSSQTARSYRVEASPNLLDWMAISTNVTASGSFILTEQRLANTHSRFYRVVLVP